MPMKYDDVIRNWWAGRFPDATPPKWDSAITCADATDLLRWHDRQTEEEFRQRHLNPSRAELSEKGKP